MWSSFVSLWQAYRWRGRSPFASKIHVTRRLFRLNHYKNLVTSIILAYPWAFVHKVCKTAKFPKFLTKEGTWSMIAGRTLYVWPPRPMALGRYD